MQTAELPRTVIAGPAPARNAGLERFLKNAASSTRQERIVEADAATTFDAIRDTDMSRATLVIALSRLRMLPDRALRRLRRLPPPPQPKDQTIRQLIESGYWIVVEDQPPHRLVLGLSMWDNAVERNGLTRERFDRPCAGAVRVCWSLTVAPVGPSRSRLITETRTEPTNERARRRFRLYWTLISAFAALTRRLVLNEVAAEAEQRFNSGLGSSPAREGREREIRARRDAICARQRSWEDFDVPGDGYCAGEEGSTSVRSGP